MIYRDLDVLILDYNRDGPIVDRFSRDFVVLDATTGLRTAAEHSESPAAVRPFKWTAIGREEISAMLAFLNARKGRAVPFWLPSFQWDLTLTEDVTATQSVLSLVWMRYTQQMFGMTGARRHVALWTLNDGSSMDCYRIAAANDPATGLTETVTIDPTAAADYPAASTVVSFLKLCRLEDDRVTITYPSVNVAEAEILVREIPLEAPTAAA
jgi:hypothetical protein